MSKKMEWSETMIASLRSLRAEGVALYLCAEKIGVGYPTALFKARELDLAQRLNRGRRPGTAVMRDRR